MLSDTRAESLVWAERMRRLIFFQFAVLTVVTVVTLLFFGGLVGVSFLAGGLLVCLNAWFMAGSLSSDNSNQKLLYRSAVIRYIGVFFTLFSLAMVGADLLAVCVGMFVVYLAGYAFAVRGVLAGESSL